MKFTDLPLEMQFRVARDAAFYAGKNTENDDKRKMWLDVERRCEWERRNVEVNYTEFKKPPLHAFSARLEEILFEILYDQDIDPEDIDGCAKRIGNQIVV